jgi:hypothetical protein
MSFVLLMNGMNDVFVLLPDEKLSTSVWLDAGTRAEGPVDRLAGGIRQRPVFPVP